MSVLEAFISGREARRVQDAANQANAMQGFLAQNGQAIFNGDPNALGALAGMGAPGLEAAMGMRNSLDQRAQMEAQNARAGIENQRADQEWAMQVEQYAATKTAAEREAEAAQIEDAVKMGLAAQSPEEWDSMVTQAGSPDLVGQFDNRQAIATRYLEVADIIKGQQPPSEMDALDLEKKRLEVERLRSPADADPITKNVKLADGSEVVVQWNPQTRVWDPAPLPEGGTTGAGIKLTESQSKLTLFQTLQNETAPVLKEMEKAFDPANLGDPMAARLPIVGNYFTSPEYQQYITAAGAWAEGALRIATGAAATQPEIERNIKTYFAQPGDTPETVLFKQQMREMYARAVDNALGAPASPDRLMTPGEFAGQLGVAPPTADQPAAPPAVDTSSPDYQAFASNPAVKAAAEKYGVSIEDMWEIQQGKK